MKTPVKPAFVVLGLFFVVIVLTIYGAGEVRDEVDKHEFLREGAVRNLLTEVVELQGSLGITALREALGSVRGAINDKYTVLEKPEEVEPPPPPVDVAPPPVVAGAPRHWTVPRPRRVLVAGASSIQFAIGVELERRMPKYSGVKVKRFGQLATGLVRPDFFDWPKKMKELTDEFKPDLVIANFGGNDAQSIPTGKYKKVAYSSDAWNAAYREHVFKITNITDEAGAGVVFLGMPVMRSPKFTKKMKRVNAQQKIALREAGGLFVSTWQMSGTDGKYKKSIRYGGKRGLMRTSDGVHYSKLGARYVVEQSLQEIERSYILEPKAAELARAETHFAFSKTLSSTISFTAYVPKGDVEDLPSIVVLREANASWAEWPQHPHRKAQELAQANNVVIILMGPESVDNPALTAQIVQDELLGWLPTWLPVSKKVVAMGRGDSVELASALARGDNVVAKTAFKSLKIAEQLAETDAEVRPPTP